ncbi:Glycine-rich RNA-binding protein 2, mitochondrial [Emydomyces testavorans]|uniref:Glycine-rich RNA-binding protein 2, mitochondrial n=1 Tax=Emydomyces testavorans TaxID=2070801 RepID=A0AAF0DLG0_9EURO|nr:Glycine-rich RNA-binding protein 2, mitochondrial [Emydomyces testavorans]
MARILLTGGSGFIAAHVLDTLLERGHSVATTVRSEEKAQRIRDAHPGVPKDKLDFVIVPDIAKPDAFDMAVISNPPFEIVIHTASPFHFRITDAYEDLIKPAINGTVGILRAIKNSAPTVKRVVITSSFAAMIDVTKPSTYVYSEVWPYLHQAHDDWNPMSEAQAGSSPMMGYRASKTFACNPPLVIGPVVHHLGGLDAINTSNERIRDFITGAAKNGCPRTGTNLWVDVRDIALAHALAAEKPEAANQRFFIVAGKFCNKEIVEIISNAFPELRSKLPEGEALKPGDYPPEGSFGFSNQRSKDILKLTYRPLRESVVDAVKSLQCLMKQ